MSSSFEVKLRPYNNSDNNNNNNNNISDTESHEKSQWYCRLHVNYIYYRHHHRPATTFYILCYVYEQYHETVCCYWERLFMPHVLLIAGMLYEFENNHPY